MGVSVALPVSLSAPLRALGRPGASVSSADLHRRLQDLLDPHCPCVEQRRPAAEADVGVKVGGGVAAAPSLQCQAAGGASWWQCRSGRVLAAWCWAAQPPQALRWAWPGLRSPRAPCRGSWAVV